MKKWVLWKYDYSIYDVSCKISFILPEYGSWEFFVLCKNDNLKKIFSSMWSISTDYANIRNELTEVTSPISASPVPASDTAHCCDCSRLLLDKEFKDRSSYCTSCSNVSVFIYVLSPLRYITFLKWILKFLYQKRKERTNERRTRTCDWRRNSHLETRNTVRATRWRKYFEDRQSPKTQTKRRIRQMDIWKTTVTECARRLLRSWDTWTMKMSFESYALLTHRGTCGRSFNTESVTDSYVLKLPSAEMGYWSSRCVAQGTLSSSREGVVGLFCFSSFRIVFLLDVDRLSESADVVKRWRCAVVVKLRSGSKELEWSLNAVIQERKSWWTAWRYTWIVMDVVPEKWITRDDIKSRTLSRVRVVRVWRWNLR